MYYDDDDAPTVRDSLDNINERLLSIAEEIAKAARPAMRHDCPIPGPVRVMQTIGGVVTVADATALPFATGAFDLVTVAFGLRNIDDTVRGLTEMARVLKPGGRLAILEFSLPHNRLVRSAYLWYFRHVLPFIGNVVARNRSDAYTYLNRSVEAFPSGAALAAIVREAGFSSIEMIPLTCGIATLSIATRSDVDG